MIRVKVRVGDDSLSDNRSKISDNQTGMGALRAAALARSAARQRGPRWRCRANIFKRASAGYPRWRAALDFPARQRGIWLSFDSFLIDFFVEIIKILNLNFCLNIF